MMDDNSWHLEKRWRIAELVGISVMVIGSLLYNERRLAAVEQAVALQKATQESQARRDDSQDKAVTESMAQIRYSIERMDDKLTRYLERQPNPVQPTQGRR